MENIIYQPEELVPIAAGLAAEYGGYEHSSITYERARMLMEAVLYCIRAYQNSGNNPLMADKLPAKEAYTLGRQIIAGKVGELRELYNNLIPDFKDYGLECLKDTIIKGIPAFLMRYDIKYAPQETLLTLDYPVFKNPGTAAGVDIVLEYVKCVSLEQRFLKKFSDEYVYAALRAYHKEYEQLLENICEIVLQSVIGHMILDKPLSVMGFTKGDLEELEKIFSAKTDEELEGYIVWLLKGLVAARFDGDKGLLDYLNCAAGNIAVRIRNNIWH